MATWWGDDCITWAQPPAENLRLADVLGCAPGEDIFFIGSRAIPLRLTGVTINCTTCTLKQRFRPR